MRVIDFVNKLDELYPFANQAEWDNSGFLCGDKSAEVEKVLVTLDVDVSVLTSAVDLGCNVIVSHHPIIFGQGLKSIVDSDDALIIKFALRNNLSIISLHTNLDHHDAFVGRMIAKHLEYPVIDTFIVDDYPLGVVVRIDKGISDIVSHIKEKFDYKGVKCCGVKEHVNKALIIGGAGSGVVNSFTKSNIDLFITGDLRHSDFHDAYKNGKSMIEIGHYEEFYAMKEVLKSFDLEVIYNNKNFYEVV